MSQVVVGLAGHIDHGKTAVVQALTGINTDRLDEEIRRGMTIDIGFAFLTDEITLIDVPGHEKFVKNMMTGVSSVDAAILVIAADDGVMPQTREHFDILKLLDVKVGCVALNKIDLADEEWLELVEMDIHDLLEGSFLENAPVVRVSAVQNKGFDKLRETVLDMCSRVPEKSDRGMFRLSIDRVFSMKGFGTVATGTVAGGSAGTGDQIELLPGHKTAKIRNLQSHGNSVEHISLGDRAAVNLQGIEKSELVRGCQLSTPGYFTTVSQFAAKVNLLTNTQKPIKQNQRLRIHVGTQEVIGRISIVDDKYIHPGSEASAVFRLEKDIVAAWNDRFILRTFSPILTIGGGQVLDIGISGKWKTVRAKTRTLYQGSPEDQLGIIINDSPAQPMRQQELPIRLGLTLSKIEELKNRDPDLRWMEYKGEKWLVSVREIRQLQTRILDYLSGFHQKNRFRQGVQREEIRQHIQGNDRFIEALLLELEKLNRIQRTGEFWSLPGHSVQLSKEEQKTLDSLLDILEKEGFSSSSLDELSRRMHKTVPNIRILLETAEQKGDLIRVEGNLMFTAGNFEKLKQKVLNHFKTNDELSVPVFKDLAETTRKYAVPLLEYLDKQKITYRAGNVRKLV